MRLGIDRTQYIKPFPSRRGGNKKTVPEPQMPQERRPDKMGGIDKKHFPGTRHHFFKPWFKFLFYKILLLFLAGGISLFGRD